MDGRRRRGGSPDLSYGTSVGIARNRSVILGAIQGYYKEALHALPLEEMPDLAPRLLEAGVCFGFADPVTNIIANTLCFLPDKSDDQPEPDPHGGAAKKRKRNKTTRAWVLSEIVAAGDVPSSPEERTVAERSLEGLITFLTSYFRCLLTWDALRYLRLAKADLLVAVRLIELDRCYNNKKDEFYLRSYAVKTALKYAAMSARQPNVDDFLTASFSLPSHLKFITSQTMLADRSCRRLSIEKINLLSGMLKKPLLLNKSDNPMVLADERRVRNCHSDATSSAEKVPAGLTVSLRAVLLDIIHAQYMKAFSRLPMQDVRARYHRAIVYAGYSYGPFSCVNNIIVNTIWYDSTFPALEKIEVDMICTPIFVRVESRSLNGLIKLLLACIPEISEHDAMVYLLKNNLKVHEAIQMARTEGCESTWDVSSAYRAAADASFHPELEAYVQFVTQSLPLVQSAVESLLRGSTLLSSAEVLQLSVMLSSSNCISAKPLETIVDLSKEAREMFMGLKETFISQQGFFRRKIEAALKKKGYLYELQFICVANERVGSQKSFLDFKCPFSHVNFLASSEVGSGLKLFFAEFSNYDDDDQSFCCIVSSKSKHVRCCYCEFEGIRIVHPIHPVENYCGGDIDFARMACRGHDLTNEMIVSGGKSTMNGVRMRGEDYIYFDPTRDVELAQRMNYTALRENAGWMTS